MESGDELVKRAGLHRRALAGLKWLGAVALDQLYPPVCLACAQPVATADTVCATCFKKLRAITAPLCPRLGLPFEVSLGGDAVSAEAIADPPPFERARAAVIYNEPAQAIVTQLKYSDRPELARFCARLMVGAGHELLAADAVLVPVPLHETRLRSRRYNQSGELARQINRLTGVPVDTGLVRRTRRTRQQVGLSGEGRARNVAGAFAIDPDGLVRLAGRRVVLIDDVYTTGATVKAVTRALKKGGIAAVDVLSFARVVIGAEITI